MGKSRMTLSDDHSDDIRQLKDASKQVQMLIDRMALRLQQQQTDPSKFTQHSNIPDVITRYRLEHKLQKGDLALLAGVTPNTLTKLNKDHTSMRVDTLLAILESLGLTLYVGPVLTTPAAGSATDA
jgi:DNA-binding XRE family transcriptional regulator